MKSRIRVNLLEVREKEGSLWKVSVLPEGPSQNEYRGYPIYYPRETLKKVAHRLEGVPVYIYQLGDAAFDHFPKEYREHQGSFLANLVGWLRSPRVETIDGRTHLVADLYIHKGARAVRDFLKDAWQAGKRLGLSIVAEGLASFKRYAGRMYAWMEDLFFTSVDPVSHPATDARFLSLLESEREKGGRMTDLLSRKLVGLANKLAPDLIADLGEADSQLTKDEAIALVTNLMETLNPESFPEASLKDLLGRVREAIEAEDFEGAATMLAHLPLGEEARTEAEPKEEGEAASSPVLEQEPPRAGVPKDDMERLTAHFGEEIANKLVEILGDRAVECLPPRGTKVGTQEENPLWEKLRELLTLIQKGDRDSAIKLLNAILAGNYPSPYPYPKPTAAKVEEENPLWEKLKDLLTLIQKEDWVSATKLLAAILAGAYPSPYPYPKPAPKPAPQGYPYPKPAAAQTSLERLRKLEERLNSLAAEDRLGKEELQSILKENLEPLKALLQEKTSESELESLKQLEQLEARLAEQEHRAQVKETTETLEELLSGSKLPEPARARVRSRFSGTAASRQELQEAIDAEEAYIEALQHIKEQPAAKSPLEERLDALEAKLTELVTEKKKASLEEHLKEKLKETALPTPAERRLYKRLFEEGNIAELTPEKIAESVKEENEFVDALIGAMASQVTGMGGPGEAISVQESEKVLEKFFAEAFDLEEKEES